MMILLYYKKALGPSFVSLRCMHACEEWYDIPHEMSSTFFRDSIGHDD